MQTLIVAFDGLVAETLQLRAAALDRALTREGVDVSLPAALLAVPGRTLHEAIAVLVGDNDQTLVDMVALRAQQDVSTRMGQGVSLAMNARAFIDAQRPIGARLVLRADSLRRDVERVLQLTDLEWAFTFVRCSDDLPRARGVSSVEGAYVAINQRLDALGGGDRRAVEYTAHAADIARRVMGHASVTQRLDATA